MALSFLFMACGPPVLRLSNRSSSVLMSIFLNFSTTRWRSVMLMSGRTAARMGIRDDAPVAFVFHFLKSWSAAAFARGCRSSGSASRFMTCWGSGGWFSAFIICCRRTSWSGPFWSGAAAAAFDGCCPASWPLSSVNALRSGRPPCPTVGSASSADAEADVDWMFLAASMIIAQPSAPPSSPIRSKSCFAVVAASVALALFSKAR
mmetsp:Transcript_28440/g.80351  ORF Transcript_28440/g.80351 Transcript_28440/m.80351 type:complete len:205 (+) Transcript_28440:607-1221(+)